MVSDDEVLFVFVIDINMVKKQDIFIQDRLLKLYSVSVSRLNKYILISFKYNNGSGIECYSVDNYGVSYLRKFEFDIKMNKELILCTK